MKKVVSLCLIVLVSGILISCKEKTKEEKFISDVEDFVQKIENVTSVSNESDFESLELWADEFGKKIAELYGVEDIDKISKSDLKLSDEQIDKLYKLRERLINHTTKLRKQIEGSSLESSEFSEGITDEADDTSETEEAIEELAKFVSKLEDISTMTESMAEDLNKEFKHIEEKYKNFNDSDLSEEQQVRLQKLRKKFEKEQERLNEMLDPFSSDNDEFNLDDDNGW